MNNHVPSDFQNNNHLIRKTITKKNEKDINANTIIFLITHLLLYIFICHCKTPLPVWFSISSPKLAGNELRTIKHFPVRLIKKVTAQYIIGVIIQIVTSYLIPCFRINKTHIAVKYIYIFAKQIIKYEIFFLGNT